MKKPLFNHEQKYNFSDYAEINIPLEEIVAAFGYGYTVEKIKFSQEHSVATAIIQRLNSYYDNIFLKVNLTNELAKREFLIAPILIELAQYLAIKIYVEYPLYVNDQLSGYLDYLLTTQNQLVVIEAKKKDLDGGFNQLAAELIALDQAQESTAKPLYGAITLGDLWKFAILNRNSKILIKDIFSYTIPHDTAELVTILLNILAN